ncbi:conserved hypothetical protein [Nitrosococcus halophilus Nc 4]|uniref:DUF3644 domain-containing protein n=1 Tax=Nitrosococcus halophilus (strain Nc4) TaxID=472759 RepID=D5C3X6_NITHN|nr:DUF3644 domain-containing protein [Nitrosococcus halophilus]ADE15098.1 conserved hypothetical protein [Nitrosococcus halophilus Nc 4]
MKSRSRNLADKSIDAMLAAIEIYNKPSFAYREESFSILAINAWELLLKARILQLSNNKVSSILKYEKRQKAGGSLSEKKYRVKNRSGTNLSIGLFRAIDMLEAEYGDKVGAQVRKNIELLCEVRDSAVHFVNKGFDLTLLVQQLGTACLRNYIIVIRRWFAIDLSKYNFFLMPLAFFGLEANVQGVSLNSEEKRLSEYLKQETNVSNGGDPDEFNVALTVNVRFTKSKSEDAELVCVSNDPDATPIKLTEEDIREKYPWDYKILTTRLRKRYSDFKENKKYHDLRKPLESEPKYCNKRFLDPAQKNGIGKCFYNPNIVKEFDAHYTKAASK